MKRRTTAGLSLIEMLIVVAIAGVITVVAIPMTINAVKSYKLSSAVAAATGAIQSTRYAEIMHGYPGTTATPYGYQIVFTPATNSYQVYNMVPPATTFSAVGEAVPISRIGDVTISRTVTFQFSANGMVTETSSPPNMVFQIFAIQNAVGFSNTITVSTVGSILVSSP